MMSRCCTPTDKVCGDVADAAEHDEVLVADSDADDSWEGTPQEECDPSSGAAGKPHRRQRFTETTALAAEKLLLINAGAASTEERDAALAQLSRFRGAFRALARGAPFSVWVRFEAENPTAIAETADFFKHDLHELVRARRARATERSAAVAKAGMLAGGGGGAGCVGCRAPLPALRRRLVVPTTAAAESDMCGATTDLQRLSRGERAAMSLLSIERDDSCASLGAFGAGREGCGSVGGSDGAVFSPAAVASPFVQFLSPYAIYSDESRSAASAASLSPGAGREGDDSSYSRSGPHKRLRESHAGDSRDGRCGAAAQSQAARKLDFGAEGPDDYDHASSSPHISLSGTVIDQFNQRALREWLRGSQHALMSPY